MRLQSTKSTTTSNSSKDQSIDIIQHTALTPASHNALFLRYLSTCFALINLQKKNPNKGDGNTIAAAIAAATTTTTPNVDTNTTHSPTPLHPSIFNKILSNFVLSTTRQRFLPNNITIGLNLAAQYTSLQTLVYPLWSANPIPTLRFPLLTIPPLPQSQSSPSSRLSPSSQSPAIAEFSHINRPVYDLSSIDSLPLPLRTLGSFHEIQHMLFNDNYMSYITPEIIIKFQTCLQYQFNHPILFVIATTHPALCSNKPLTVNQTTSLVYNLEKQNYHSKPVSLYSDPSTGAISTIILPLNVHALPAKPIITDPSKLDSLIADLPLTTTTLPHHSTITTPNLPSSVTPIDIIDVAYHPRLDYQVLEFIGDSVLDLIFLSFFIQSWPEATPNILHFLKRTHVCKDTLARTCLHHALYTPLFHQFDQYDSLGMASSTSQHGFVAILESVLQYHDRITGIDSAESSASTDQTSSGDVASTPVAFPTTFELFQQAVKSVGSDKRSKQQQSAELEQEVQFYQKCCTIDWVSADSIATVASNAPSEQYLNYIFSLIQSKEMVTTVGQLLRLKRQQDSPKFFSDLVESIIGAIYLDSGYNLQTVWKVLNILFGHDLRQLLLRLHKKPPTL